MKSDTITLRYSHLAQNHLQSAAVNMLNLAGDTAYSGREPVNNMTGKSLIISGAGKRIRTVDLLITNFAFS